MLNSRPIRALLAAQVISVTGAQMTWLALPWFVLTTTGSATRTSVVMGAEAVGLAAFGIQSGNLVNRLGARRTMLLCDALRAPTVAVIPILHWTGALSFPVLLLAAAAIGVLSAPYFAAQKVIVPEILGEDERIVTKMQTLSQSASRITMLLGPVIAGVLIGLIGASSVLMVDAVTYLVAVGLVAGFVPAGRRAPVPGEERGSRAGIRFVLRDPLLRWWMPVFTIGDAAWMAIFVALPVLTVQRYDSDPRVAGWLFASFGVGAIVGNIVAFRLLDRTDGLRLIGLGILGQALPLWLLVLELPGVARLGHAHALRPGERARQPEHPRDLDAPRSSRPPCQRHGGRDDPVRPGDADRASGSRPAAGRLQRRGRVRAVRCDSDGDDDRRSDRRVPRQARYGASSSNSFAFAQRAAKPACRKSFAAEAPSDQVSSRPNRGDIISVETSAAALQVPRHRGHVTSSPMARWKPVPAGCSSSPVSASPSTKGWRTKLPTRSLESVRETLKVAAASAASSSAVLGGERRDSAATVARPPRKMPAIVA